MFPCEYLLALAMLTAPVDGPEATSPDTFTALAPALQALALQWEILDPREVPYVLAQPGHWADDLTLLRRRYQDLRGAPPLSDRMRFPEREVVSDMIAFNRAYRQNLDRRLAVETVRAWELEEAARETDYLYRVWDLVRDARCDYYEVTVRRQALQRLRDLVGAEAYYGGLPPYVPLWRFQTID
jgi:hypothetical protein